MYRFALIYILGFVCINGWFGFVPQLQAEVQRLEKLKLENIHNVTDAIRSEIAVFWEKCFFSAEQRQVFTPYFSGELTCLILQLSSSE